MADNNLIPISDAQAELGKEIIETGRGLFKYLADIAGDLPQDLLGLLVGDRVKVKRAEQIAILWARAKKRLQDRGVIDPEPPSLKLALPILAAAADESREELQKIWEGLLAAAMDPERQNLVRQSLITTVKAMDPFDALVFDIIANRGEGAWDLAGRDFIAAKLATTTDDVLVSFANLHKLKLIDFPGMPVEPMNPYLSPLGKLLIKAIA